MRNDTEDKFSRVLLPSLLLWYGDCEDVWSINEQELISALKAIIKVVFPSGTDELNMITHKSPIYGLVCWLCLWLPSNSTFLAVAGIATSQLLASQLWLYGDNNYV